MTRYQKLNAACEKAKASLESPTGIEMAKEQLDNCFSFAAETTPRLLELLYAAQVVAAAKRYKRLLELCFEASRPISAEMDLDVVSSRMGYKKALAVVGEIKSLLQDRRQSALREARQIERALKAW